MVLLYIEPVNFVLLRRVRGWQLTVPLQNRRYSPPGSRASSSTRRPDLYPWERTAVSGGARRRNYHTTLHQLITAKVRSVSPATIEPMPIMSTSVGSGSCCGTPSSKSNASGSECAVYTDTAAPSVAITAPAKASVVNGPHKDESMRKLTASSPLPRQTPPCPNTDRRWLMILKYYY